MGHREYVLDVLDCGRQCYPAIQEALDQVLHQRVARSEARRAAQVEWHEDLRDEWEWWSAGRVRERPPYTEVDEFGRDRRHQLQAPPPTAAPQGPEVPLIHQII